MRIQKKQKVAVFDIDGTLFRSSLLIEVVEALIRKKLFPVHAREDYEAAYHKWLDRKGEYDDYIMGVVRAFMKHIRGVESEAFVRVARGVAALHADRVYRFTRDLATRLKKKGYFLLAISLSPKFIVEEFAKKRGFDKVYGFIYDVDARGRFTGKGLYEEEIRDKAKILMRAVSKENLTLNGSVGVGDSESDVAFLKFVERPIAFNPNQTLYREAKRKKWEVVVERKNVVYHI